MVRLEQRKPRCHFILQDDRNGRVRGEVSKMQKALEKKKLSRKDSTTEEVQKGKMEIKGKCKREQFKEENEKSRKK